MHASKENYRKKYELLLEQFKLEREDITDIQSICVLFAFHPTWIAKGIAHTPWGEENLVALGIGDRRTYDSPEKMVEALEEMLKFLKGGAA